MDYVEKAGRVLDIEIVELQRLRGRLGQSFGDAVELLRQAVDARGKIVVLGVGKSGHIGSKIAATLTSTGSPSVVLDSVNALHGDLGMVADGDVVRGGSPGETSLGQRRGHRLGGERVVAPLVGGQVPVDGALHLPLANVAVGNGATLLSQANLTDKRIWLPSSVNPYKARAHNNASQAIGASSATRWTRPNGRRSSTSST